MRSQRASGLSSRPSKLVPLLRRLLLLIQTLGSGPSFDVLVAPKVVLLLLSTAPGAVISSRWLRQMSLLILLPILFVLLLRMMRPYLGSDMFVVLFVWFPLLRWIPLFRLSRFLRLPVSSGALLHVVPLALTLLRMRCFVAFQLMLFVTFAIYLLVLFLLVIFLPLGSVVWFLHSLNLVSPPFSPESPAHSAFVDSRQDL